MTTNFGGLLTMPLLSHIFFFSATPLALRSVSVTHLPAHPDVPGGSKQFSAFGNLMEQYNFLVCFANAVSAFALNCTLILTTAHNAEKGCCTL